MYVELNSYMKLDRIYNIKGYVIKLFLKSEDKNDKTSLKIEPF